MLKKENPGVGMAEFPQKKRHFLRKEKENHGTGTTFAMRAPGVVNTFWVRDYTMRTPGEVNTLRVRDY